MPRILPCAAALCILTACTPRNLPDGWYTTSGEGPDAPIGTPIVTCSDFAALRLDSLPSGEDRFVYQITGSVKPEKRKRWRAATRKAVGHHIVFVRRRSPGSPPHQHPDRRGNLRHLRPRNLRQRRPDAGNLPAPRSADAVTGRVQAPRHAHRHHFPRHTEADTKAAGRIYSCPPAIYRKPPGTLLFRTDRIRYAIRPPTFRRCSAGRPRS